MDARPRLRILALTALACGCGSEGPAAPRGSEGQPVPPPGPHFSVSPIPLDSLARVTPLGHNDEILPAGYTRWHTCDVVELLNTERSCRRGRLEVRAPRRGVVWGLEPRDGSVSLEGPRGLFVILGHVTPVDGLALGDTVEAGEVVATMYLEHGIDFGVFNYGVAHDFVRDDRYPVSYRHAQHPMELYPEPERSRLRGLVSTLWDPVGRLSFDVSGTVAGNWFREGTPPEQSLKPAWVPAQLFLGPLQERQDTRILVVGERWAGLAGALAVADPAGPPWEDLTPDAGPTQVRLWGLAADGGPDAGDPRGSVLVELMGGGRLRIEWFDTHEPVTAFAGAARIYER